MMNRGSPNSTIRTLPTSFYGAPSKNDVLDTMSSQDQHSTQTRSQASSPVPRFNYSLDVEDAAAGAVVDIDEKERVRALEEREAGDWEVDPANPRNWPNSRKWRMTGVISLYTFVSPLASSMMAPALAEIGQGYHITNPTILALTLSIFLLAYALGPLILAPLSEMYGRTWVLHISNLVFVAFSVACAVAPDTASLIIFRFMAGLAGSAPLSIGAGSITDLFREENRAGAMGIYSLGTLIGPVIGPVIGGFTTVGLNYHWVFWIIAIISGTASIIGIPILRETYAPVIIARRNKRMGKPLPPPIPLGQLLWINLSRPIILLTHSFICFIMSLYMAIIYGILYLMFVTFPELYGRVYGWGPGVAGLAYLGPGIGFLIGTAFGARFVDKVYLHLKEKNNGVAEPEFRIPVMFLGSVFLPVGLLWYGWSADQHAHWIVPIIGSGLFGCGMMLCFLPIQVYLVDSFKYAASAVAAATLLRSSFGFAFPLFANRIFEALGVGPGYSLVAGVALTVGGPFPVWIYFKGKQMRARSDLNR